MDSNRVPEDFVVITPKVLILKERFSQPATHERMVYKEYSFQNYLSSFPLRPDGSQGYLVDGRLKRNDRVYATVFNIDTGTKDLQQCADAVIRLRLEYLYHQKKYRQIHFDLTNHLGLIMSCGRREPCKNIQKYCKLD